VSVTRRALGLVGALALSLILLGGMAPAAAAANGPTMDARVLLQGHARLGSWLAIEVRLQNEGAPVVGELRLQGGSQGGTRFSVPVDLPSPSDKRYTLYAQPPAFGGQIEVLLVVGDKTLASKKVAFTIHDVNQLTIGVVAAQPAGIVSGIQLPATQNNALWPPQATWSGCVDRNSSARVRPPGTKKSSLSAITTNGLFTRDNASAIFA